MTLKQLNLVILNIIEETHHPDNLRQLQPHVHRQPVRAVGHRANQPRQEEGLDYHYSFGARKKNFDIIRQ